MKRSSQVALLLMGVTGAGASAYAVYAAARMRRAGQTGGVGARRDQSADARSRRYSRRDAGRDAGGAVRPIPAFVLGLSFLLVRSFVWLQFVADAANRAAQPVLAVAQPHLGAVGGA